MHMTVIIPAAGRSARFAEPGVLGEARSKLDEDLGGRPVLQRAVELFNTRDDVGAIVVAGPHEEGAYAEFQLRHADRLAMLGAALCRGGRTHRYETVRAALEQVPAEATHVAIHDAARPACPADLIDRVFAAAVRHDAVIPAVAIDDTVKRTTDPAEDDTGADPLEAILGASERPTIRTVADTLDRTNLVLVQTPQVFEVGLLRRAYAQDDLASTDDAGLIERLGEPVVVVPGDVANIKITRPADVGLCRAIMGLKNTQGRPAHKKF